MEIPQKYQDLVATIQTLKGPVFSRSKLLPATDYVVLGIRLGNAHVVRMADFQSNGQSAVKHPTFELLVKNAGMEKARWTRPFPIKEVKLKISA